MEKWVIQDEKTGMYFSLLGSPHFTTNEEIRQVFATERDAILCEEQYIHCEPDFNKYDTWPVKIS